MSINVTPIKPIEVKTLEQLKNIDEKTEQNSDFKNILASAINDTREAQKVSDQNSFDLSSGDVEDLSKIQIDALRAQTMLQTTVQLTTRTVNAYKEIMQMQI